MYRAKCRDGQTDWSGEVRRGAAGNRVPSRRRPGRRKTLVPGAQLMGVRRVAVVGSGGAGKWTFARQLGERTGIPVVHLDHHYWKPGWVQTAPHQWWARQAELVAGESWIIDGNYGGTFDVRFPCADTVIVLAPLTCSCRLVCAGGLTGEESAGRLLMPATLDQ